VIPDSPFSPAFSRQSFLETAGAADALRRLEAGLGAREPFLLLTGEPGTGKTTLVHEAIARWEGRVAVAPLAYPALTGAELLEEIVRRFGGEVPDGASRPKLVACLEGALARIAGQGQVAMVVVDDAQKLSAELLEELRLLAGAAQQAGRSLEVLLAGLPALEALLEDPALDALRQRVSVRARLEPLPAGETRRYLRHRVDAAGGDGAALFPRKSCNEVVGLTLGVPRRINALASEALRLAREAGAEAVSPEHVRAAAASLWGEAAARVVPTRDEEDESEKVSPASAPAPAPSPGKEAKRGLAGERPAAPKATAPPAPTAAAPPPRVAAGPPAAAQPPRAAAPAPLDDADVAPRPAPTHHDPNEWVARFIGDKGPIQIGSQAGGHFTPLREPFESAGEGGPAPAGGASPSGGPKPRSRAVSLPSARPRRRRGGLRVATYATLAGCAVIAAVVLLARTRGGPTASPARTAVAVADSQAAPAKGAPRATRTATSAPIVTVVRPPSARAATGERPAAAAPAAKPVSPTGRWTVEVASAYDLQSAFDERDRIEELVGIEGWVVPAPEGSSAPHRIVLGIYRAHGRANAAAKMLTSSRTLPAARVVPLPRRSERR